MTRFLDPAARYPMRFPSGREKRELVHLARAIEHPNTSVGDFTSASSFDPPGDWGDYSLEILQSDGAVVDQLYQDMYA